MTTKPTKRYDYRGLIERGAQYRWVEGYSETTPNGNPLYPWSTRRECRAEAKADGFKAIFFRDGRCETVSRLEKYLQRQGKKAGG
jgi:hypothetical protein